jgi:MFS family permease
VIGCFGAGLVNSAVLTLAPLFASDAYGAAAAATFYASAWIGTLLAQWPAGRISDRVDRRMVIAALAGLATISAIPLALLGSKLPEWAAIGLFFLWGAGGLSFYGVAVAHMADRAEPGRSAQFASGLLFVWAAGSIIGPLALGPLVDLFSWPAVFWFAALVALCVSLAMFWRRRQRVPSEPAVKEDYAPYPATSVAVAEIALREERPKP